MFFVCIIVLIFLLILNSTLLKKFVNYLNIYIIIWLIPTFLSYWNFFGFTRPSDKTYWYIIISIIIFNIASLFLIKTKFTFNREKRNNNKHINMKLLTVISIILLLSVIPETKIGFDIIKNHGFNYLRNTYLNGLLYTNFQKIYLVYIFRPLSMAIYIYSLLNILDKKKGKLVLMFSIVNFIQYMFIFGSRSFLFELMLITGIIICDKYKKIGKIIKHNKKIVLLLLALILILFYITLQRNVSKSGGGLLVNIYLYFIGGIHLFDYLNNNVAISLLDGKHLLYGYATFNGFLEPFKIIISMLFKVNLKTGIEIINEVTQNYYLVGEGLLMNNNVTYLYVFLRDFGVIGLIICPFLLAIVYSTSYKNKENNIGTRAIYYFLLSVMPYFLFEFRLAICGSFLTIIYIIILYGLCSTKKER